MTDEEKRAAIEALVDAEPHVDDCPAPEFLARVRSMGERIRAILADVPRVKWVRLPSTRDAWHAFVDGENLLSCRRSRIGGDHWIASAYYGGHSEAHAYDLPDRDSAKRRALALYVALRGVT